MSYSKFKKACINKNPEYMRIDDTTSIINEIRDEWLREGLFKQLVSFVNSNYDTVSSKPMDFIIPIREMLIKSQEVELLIKLSKKLIKVHTEDLWFYLPQLKNIGGTLNSEQLEDRHQRVNKSQSGALLLLTNFVNDLEVLKYSDSEYTEQIKNLIACVKIPKKPRPMMSV